MYELQIKVMSILLLLHSLALSNSESRTDTCTQISPCECVYNNGVGINLNGINRTILEVENSSRIIFQPCSNFDYDADEASLNSTKVGNVSFVDNECKQTSLCLIIVKMVNLGSYTDFHFKPNTNSGKMYFVSKYNGLTTEIELRCQKNSNQSTIEVSSINMKDKISLILDSPHVCLTSNVTQPETSSGRNVVLILLLIIFLGYFIGGMLFKKFLYGAVGLEMIPNYAFWTDLYSRIQNLFLFLLNGCQINRASSSYDQI